MLFKENTIISVPVYIASDHLQYRGRRLNVTNMSFVEPFIGTERYVTMTPVSAVKGYQDNRWKSDDKQLFQILYSTIKRNENYRLVKE